MVITADCRPGLGPVAKAILRASTATPDQTQKEDDEEYWAADWSGRTGEMYGRRRHFGACDSTTWKFVSQKVDSRKLIGSVSEACCYSLGRITFPALPLIWQTAQLLFLMTRGFPEVYQCHATLATVEAHDRQAGALLRSTNVSLVIFPRGWPWVHELKPSHP